MNASDQTVLVTGASGFIGCRLCAFLKQEGYPVRAMVRQPQTFHDFDGVTSCYGDLEDPDSLAQACDRVHTVYHLAGVAHTGRSWQPLYQRMIVDATENLLEAAIAAGVKRLVYFSSSLATAAALHPKLATAYGLAKLEAEKNLQKAQQRGAIEIAILRPVNVYGPGMKGNIATMIRLIQKRRLPPLPRLQNRLSLVSVKDLCRAALLTGTLSRAVGNTWLVSDGRSYRINDIEAAVYQALGRKKPGWHSPRVVLYLAALGAEILGKEMGLKTWQNLVNDNLIDSRKLESELGFRPGASLYDELPAIIAAL
ncbi:MAG: NAD-dependent epimerase/dehydratase family protein [Pseudohongiellaceae bacterium]